MRDEAHALGRERGGVVQDVLAAAGFRPRSQERKVRGPFSAVVAYAGGMAFVYVADRSRCNDERCDWASAPRRRDDLIPAADALFEASKDRRAPLGGKLDMILVRSVRPDPPFEVYVGAGRTVSVRKWLEDDQPYESWHGSPSASDSIIPVIIANASESSAELAKSADRVFGRAASQQEIAALVLYLREHE